MTWDQNTDSILVRVPEANGYKVLEDCILYSRIGEGGFGAVYQAFHMRMEMDVAVKCMKPQLDAGPALRAELQKRFVREAQFGARITHQNLVGIKDVRTAHDVDYIVMEYIRGENAEQRLRRKRVLSVPEVTSIVRFAALGLAEVHSRTSEDGEPCAHRDVKPQNIMVATTGRVKILDLGLVRSRQANSSHTSLGMGAAGTPPYMPPEQFDSFASAGPAADVWALGATLYSLLTGEAPFRGSEHEIRKAVTTGAFPDVAAKRADVPAALRAIIERCTRKDPSERFRTAAEFAVALDPFATLQEADLADQNAGRDGDPSPLGRPSAETVASIQHEIGAAHTPPFPATFPPTVPPPPHRSPVARAAAILCVILSAVGGYLWLAADEGWPPFRPSPSPNPHPGPTPVVEKSFRTVAMKDLCDVSIGQADGTRSGPESRPMQRFAALEAPSLPPFTAEQVVVNVKRHRAATRISVTVGLNRAQLTPNPKPDHDEYTVDIPVGTTSLHLEAVFDDPTEHLDASATLSLTRERATVPFDTLARIEWRCEPGAAYGAPPATTTAESLDVRIVPASPAADLTHVTLECAGTPIPLDALAAGTSEARIPLGAAGRKTVTCFVSTATKEATSTVVIERSEPERRPAAPIALAPKTPLKSNADSCEVLLEGPPEKTVVTLVTLRGRTTVKTPMSEPFDRTRVQLSCRVSGQTPMVLDDKAARSTLALAQADSALSTSADVEVVANWHDVPLAHMTATIHVDRQPPTFQFREWEDIDGLKLAMSYLEGNPRLTARLHVSEPIEVVDPPSDSTIALVNPTTIQVGTPLLPSGASVSVSVRDAAGNEARFDRTFEDALAYARKRLPLGDDPAKGRRFLVLPFLPEKPAKQSIERRAFAPVFDPNAVKGEYEADRITTECRDEVVRRLRELVPNVELIDNREVDSILGVIDPPSPGVINAAALNGSFDHGVAARLAVILRADGWIQGSFKLLTDGAPENVSYRVDAQLTLTLYAVNADGTATERGRVDLRAKGATSNQNRRDIVDVVRPEAVRNALQVMIGKYIRKLDTAELPPLHLTDFPRTLGDATKR